jgi:hypothetical protein
MRYASQFVPSRRGCQPSNRRSARRSVASRALSQQPKVQVMNPQMTFQRVCAIAGVITPILFFGAFIAAGFIPPLAPSASAGEIAAHYREHASRHPARSGHHAVEWGVLRHLHRGDLGSDAAHPGGAPGRDQYPTRRRRLRLSTTSSSGTTPTQASHHQDGAGKASAGSAPTTNAATRPAARRRRGPGSDRRHPHGGIGPPVTVPIPRAGHSGVHSWVQTILLVVPLATERI